MGYKDHYIHKERNPKDRVTIKVKHIDINTSVSDTITMDKKEGVIAHHMIIIQVNKWS